jgi:hypothetical protein
MGSSFQSKDIGWFVAGAGGGGRGLHSALLKEYGLTTWR